MERPTQFRDPELDTSGDVIGFYPREFYFLDNFSAFQVNFACRMWPTNEHLYNAFKFFETAPEIAEEIFNAASPHDAQKIAQTNKDKLPPNWYDIKVEVMHGLCATKLSQHPYIQRKLLDTGDLDIVEDSTKDAFWGWGPNRDGRNELGKIWMRLRTELRLGQLAVET